MEKAGSRRSKPLRCAEFEANEQKSSKKDSNGFFFSFLHSLNELFRLYSQLNLARKSFKKQGKALKGSFRT